MMRGWKKAFITLKLITWFMHVRFWDAQKIKAANCWPGIDSHGDTENQHERQQQFIIFSSICVTTSITWNALSKTATTLTYVQLTNLLSPVDIERYFQDFPPTFFLDNIKKSCYISPFYFFRVKNECLGWCKLMLKVLCCQTVSFHPFFKTVKYMV